MPAGAYIPGQHRVLSQEAEERANDTLHSKRVAAKMVFAALACKP